MILLIPSILGSVARMRSCFYSFFSGVWEVEVKVYEEVVEIFIAVRESVYADVSEVEDSFFYCSVGF